MSVAIYIATTQGPVRIVRLTAEDPDVQSVVCRYGSAEPLPISPLYQGFVSRGSGLIEKRTSHGAWRLDLSDTIEQGNSWQLAVTLAHELKQQGLLAEGDSDSNTLIWATGAIDPVEQRVQTVESITDKLNRSRELIRCWQRNGKVIKLLLPEANQDAIPQGWIETEGLDPALVSLHAVGTLEQAIALLPETAQGSIQTSAPASTQTPVTLASLPATTPVIKPRSRWGIASAVALLIAAVATVTLNQSREEATIEPMQSQQATLLPSRTKTQPAALVEPTSRSAPVLPGNNAPPLAPHTDRLPAQVTLAIAPELILSYRNPNTSFTDGLHCGASPKQQTVEALNGIFPDSALSELCEIRIVASGSEGELNAMLYLQAIALDSGTEIPIESLSAPGQWRISLPKNREQSREYAIWLISGDQVRQSLALLSAAEQSHLRGDALMQAINKKIDSLGRSYQFGRHRLNAASNRHTVDR
ncbi:hypothetical protein A9Q89_03710 [Gammaproteobacteria bacterium 53_120_T64]|nr:hypothetical protein A9Q89_03710 [Gammaproteobacteria bacterium 53_120_T64]